MAKLRGVVFRPGVPPRGAVIGARKDWLGIVCLPPKDGTVIGARNCGAENDGRV